MIAAEGSVERRDGVGAPRYAQATAQGESPQVMGARIYGTWSLSQARAILRGQYEMSDFEADVP